jgi:hypothetical protein
MASIAVICLLLLLLSTIVHYEVLHLLSTALPHIRIAPRSKLIAVLLTTFAAHTVEMLLYAVVFYLVIHHLDLGTLLSDSPTPPSLRLCFYFSAETYTSLGYGDIRPSGPLRLLAGAEALNGLLLIGWSASFAYISMERFWERPTEPPHNARDQK